MTGGIRRRNAAAIAILALAATASAQPTGARSGAALEERIRAAEDARAPDAASLQILVEGLAADPPVQRIAARAVGRLERDALVDRLVPLLAAADPLVRAEAANAVAQSVVNGSPVAASAALSARVSLEPSAAVRGVVARSLGRLPYTTAGQVSAAERSLLAIAASLPDPPPVHAVVDLAHGFEALARRHGKLHGLGAESRAWLRALAMGVPAAAATGAVEDRVRAQRLALAALLAVRGVDEELARAALAAGDAQLRRLAVLGAAGQPDAAWSPAIVEGASRDPSFLVRFEALRARDRLAPAGACVAARAAVKDESTHVALLGLDLMGRSCRGVAGAIDELSAALVRRPDPGPPDQAWHGRAHALVALARLAPARAKAAIARLAKDPVWQVRMYAARAAGVAGAVGVLDALADDAHVNVAEAALQELRNRIGHRADHHLFGALARADDQLVRTAARALAGTPRREEATQALLAALDRITAERRDTSRDARLAILDRLAETGAESAATAGLLQAHLEDHDPVVAARVAEVLSEWTSRPHAARPRPAARPAVPTASGRAALARSDVLLDLARGARVRVRLFPDEAPASVARFVRLVRARWFDGRTFHRVEPGFVIQGGSPHANEYAGDGPYTRDELGLRSHVRGTVGISTRGRDTGDGQIFVNLVDNVRLDHNYTIIGLVVEGMDAIDRVLEGDVIARAEIVARSGR